MAKKENLLKSQSEEELRKELVKQKGIVVKLGFELRAQQSNNRKGYLKAKKAVAQILTELRSRELTNTHN